MLKQRQRAIEDFDKAIQLDSDFDWAYKNRGIAYRSLGEFSQYAADKAKACSLNSIWC